jgi:5-methylcytosine-specific restriction endonuclease McrA
MNEQNNTAVAEMCQETCEFIKHRPAEFQNAQRPLGPVGSLDGQRMANSTQSAACDGKCQTDPATDMGGICSSRSRYHGGQKVPCKPERLETMGNTSGDGRKSVHSEIETDLVSRRRPTGDVCTENVMRLLAYQKYRCALTRRELTPETAALDHIIPIRLGGAHAMENVQVLHKDVNRAKGSFTNEAFIDMCREVVALWRKLRPGSATFGEPATDGAIHPPGNPVAPCANPCVFANNP